MMLIQVVGIGCTASVRPSVGDFVRQMIRVPPRRPAWLDSELATYAS